MICTKVAFHLGDKSSLSIVVCNTWLSVSWRNCKLVPATKHTKQREENKKDTFTSATIVSKRTMHDLHISRAPFWVGIVPATRPAGRPSAAKLQRSPSGSSSSKEGSSCGKEAWCQDLKSSVLPESLAVNGGGVRWAWELWWLLRHNLVVRDCSATFRSRTDDVPETPAKELIYLWSKPNRSWKKENGVGCICQLRWQWESQER